MTTILVVEDERPVRELLVMALEEVGHRVLQAHHGGQALEMIADERPDLVIADVMMPLVGGVELCQRLKAESATTHIPIILMSAAGRRAAADAGAQAFIEKPFELDSLDALIRHWLHARPGSPRAAST